MLIARVMGTVTLSQAHPSMQGCRLRCVESIESSDQLDAATIGGDLIVAWDTLGTLEGDWIALAEGPEAAQPFRPQLKPIDAFIAGILDAIEVPHTESSTPN
jgi:carbon dioxide concentrating mechanism protein CcmL